MHADVSNGLRFFQNFRVDYSGITRFVLGALLKEVGSCKRGRRRRNEKVPSEGTRGGVAGEAPGQKSHQKAQEVTDGGRRAQ